MMKKLYSIFAALLLLGATGCNSSSKPKEANDSTQVAVTATDTATAEAAQPTTAPQRPTSDPQEIQAKKDFLEKFYDGLDESGLDDAYIRKFITPNAKKILIEENLYECESGDCLAVWLFAYEGGGDTGKCLSRTIKEQDENHFLVTFKYEGEEYNVLLTVIKDGDTYKIDDIEKK